MNEPGASLSLHEVDRIGKRLATHFDENAQVIFGAQIDPSLLDDEVILTVIATGFRPPPAPPAPVDYFQYRAPEGQEAVAPPSPEPVDPRLTIPPLRPTPTTKPVTHELLPDEAYTVPPLPHHQPVSASGIVRSAPPPPAAASPPPEKLRDWSPKKPYQRPRVEADGATPQMRAIQRRQEWATQEAQGRWRPKAARRNGPSATRVMTRGPATEQENAQWGI